MSLKYIGAVLIFLSCGAVGFLKAANYRKETQCLAELARVLDAMSAELEYHIAPLPQICANIAQIATGSLNKLFLSLSKELEAQIAPDAATCMQAALTSVKEIPTQVREALVLLGNSLGKFDIQGQMNEILTVKQHCLTLLEQMQEHLNVRLRSYRTLGLCAGAALAILFL